jgi:hypothetical protein
MRAGEVGRNVAELAEWPRYRRPRLRPWQPAAFAAFLDQIGGERLAPLFHLAGHAGLRRGGIAVWCSPVRTARTGTPAGDQAVPPTHNGGRATTVLAA